MNEICPVSAFLSNNAKHFLTFDNWYSAGYGDHVIVEYDSIGDLEKHYRLIDLSPFPINNYQITISSIWWNGGAKKKDDNHVELCFIDEAENREYINYEYNE